MSVFKYLSIVSAMLCLSVSVSAQDACFIDPSLPAPPRSKLLPTKTRWYFNRSAKKCKSFRWVDSGDVEPFKSKKDCQAAECGAYNCIEPQTKANKPCKQVEQWFYNSKSDVRDISIF